MAVGSLFPGGSRIVQSMTTILPNWSWQSVGGGGGVKDCVQDKGVLGVEAECSGARCGGEDKSKAVQRLASSCSLPEQELEGSPLTTGEEPWRSDINMGMDGQFSDAKVSGSLGCIQGNGSEDYTKGPFEQDQSDKNMESSENEWIHEDDSHEFQILPSQNTTQSHRVLRNRSSTKLLLPKWGPSTKSAQDISKKNGSQRRARWSDEDLVAAIGCYDVGYKISECCQAFNIPRLSLRDHLSGRTTSRKVGAKTILTRKEEGFVIEYIDEMLDIGQPLTPQMLKLKVGEIYEGRLTRFKDDIPGDSWLH